MPEIAAEPPVHDEVWAGAHLVECLSTGLRGEHWKATAEDGSVVAVHRLSSTVDGGSRSAFIAALKTLERAAEEKAPPEGIQTPSHVDLERGAFATKLCTMGTVDDVPALRWQLNRRVELIATVAETLEWLHERGRAHGALSPAAILLDERYVPHVAGVDGVNLLVGTLGDSDEPKHFAKYASPEARAGSKVDPRSDIFSLGRILHYLLASRHPDEPDEELPKLEAIAMSPAGLVRIIRRCTSKDPAKRYPTVDALLADLVHFGHHEDVGLPHPKVEERNITGISASVLPDRFDRRAQRLAREQAEREAKALESLMPGRDVPRGGRWGLAAVGGLVLVGSVAVGFSVPGMESGANVGAGVGAALLALLIPAGRRRTLANRLVFAVGAGVFAWTLGLGALLATTGAHGRLDDENAGTRSAAVRTLLAHGERDFSGRDLSACNLERLDFTRASLEHANLRAANLAGADFYGANLAGADLAQAQLEDALLDHADLSEVQGLEETYCNRFTSVPHGIRCVDGHLETARGGSSP